MRPQRLAMLKAGTYDRENHSIEWTLSDSSKDRDGERILPEGWLVSGEPNVLDSHNAGTIQNIIGKVTGARVDGEAFVGRLVFSQANPLGRLAEAMAAEGVLDKGSVGFDPLAWTNADGGTETREAGGAYPYPQKDRVYTKQELLEFSLLGVPSNRNALSRAAKAYGIELPEEPEELPIGYAAPTKEAETQTEPNPIEQRLERVESKIDQLLGISAREESATEIATVTAETFFTNAFAECESEEANVGDQRRP